MIVLVVSWNGDLAPSAMQCSEDDFIIKGNMVVFLQNKAEHRKGLGLAFWLTSSSCCRLAFSV